MFILSVLNFIIISSVLNFTFIYDDFLLPSNKGVVLGVEEFFVNVKNAESTDIIKLPINKDQKVNFKKLLDIKKFDIIAKSGAVFDFESNELLFGKNVDENFSIASITKLMTALVFLDHNPGWDTIYEVQKKDRREGWNHSNGTRMDSNYKRVVDNYKNLQ